MRRAHLVTGFLVTTAALLPCAAAQEKAEVKVVKYDELGRLVRQHQGKVVVVDLWATW